MTRKAITCYVTLKVKFFIKFEIFKNIQSLILSYNIHYVQNAFTARSLTTFDEVCCVVIFVQRKNCLREYKNNYFFI